jgi:hypothetical protein
MRIKEMISTKQLRKLSELLCLNCSDTRLPITLWLGNFKEDMDKDNYLYLCNNDNNRLLFDLNISRVYFPTLEHIEDLRLQLQNETKLSDSTINILIIFIKRNYHIIANYYINQQRKETLLAIRNKL